MLSRIIAFEVENNDFLQLSLHDTCEYHRREVFPVAVLVTCARKNKEHITVVN